MNPALSGMLCGLLFVASVNTTHAARIHRCETDAGTVSFSERGCQPDEQSTLVDAHNPRPGSGRAVPMAKVRKTIKRSTDRETQGDVMVVGGPAARCHTTLSDKAMRTAVIRQQIKPGMSTEDVERALGKPDSISSSNGQLRYRYASKEKNGRSRTVSFDTAGCVRGKP